ncbi:MAG: Daunorubicin/doxorubicin resistance ATP-binding protein DrrA [Planctomycetota bacterium]|jgi:ABC-2 type transport system ATP-binding protein
MIRALGLQSDKKSAVIGYPVIHSGQLIELQQVTKDYGTFRALSEVTLSIGAGVTGLLGPNGAGKSTLIRVLLGLARVTRGTGHVLGIPIGVGQERVRCMVGFMPEDDCYLHGLSGIETVQMAARLSGLPSLEALRRGHEILDFCGAGQERYRQVETYSTGMRQKLRFAMAIVHDPQLLILDEPTTGLDPDERESMLNRIRILRRDFGKSVLLCTHILPDVQSVCESVVILAKGEVRVAGSLEELTRTPRPSLSLTVGGEAKRMCDELRGRGLEVEIENDHRLQVKGSADDCGSRLWEAAQAAATHIRGIEPARNSLEQIFLEAVGEVRRANT